jgi:anthranilate synthase/aminodeoxychorismate synthase-like glutamine amidotransferase
VKHRVLVVDNRDSFVFNLVHDIEELGASCSVVRSDLEPGELDELVASTEPDLVLLSPGPGRPEDHGCLLPFLRGEAGPSVLGVCLGMQAMVASLGGEVGRAVTGPVHGRSTRVLHDGDPAFRGVPSSFPAGRYHSLVARTLPSELVPIAWTEDRSTPLAVRHRELPWVGLQFHPESVLTPDGRRILLNILETLR